MKYIICAFSFLICLNLPAQFGQKIGLFEVKGGKVKGGDVADINGDGVAEVLAEIGRGIQIVDLSGNAIYRDRILFNFEVSEDIDPILCDINEDGNIDAVAGNYTRLGFGEGSFADEVQSFQYPCKYLVDINNDSYCDAISVMGDSMIVQSGKFGPEFSSPELIHRDLMGGIIKFFDWNKDGYTDMFEQVDSSLYVFENLDGTFQDPKLIVGGIGFYNFFDQGSENNNLAIVKHDSLIVFAMDRHYNLDSLLVIHTGYCIDGDIEYQDLNSDGLKDYFFTRNCDKYRQKPSYYAQLSDGTFDTIPFGFGPAGGYLKNYRMLDIDSDGDIDYLSIGGVWGGLGLLGSYMFINQGNQFIRRVGPYELIDAKIYRISDLNVDGKIDLNVTYKNVINKGNGQFALQVSNPSQYYPHTKKHDVDNDGFLDLIYSSRIGLFWKKGLNNGYGQPIVIDSIEGIKEIILRDINNDDRVDIVIDSWNGIRWYRKENNNLFSNFSIESNYGNAHNIFLSDVDGDNEDELITIRDTFIRMHDFSGETFESDDTLIGIRPKEYKSYQKYYLDINNDGYEDLIMPTKNWHKAHIVAFINNGDWTFSERNVIRKSTHGGSFVILRMTMDDYDLDGNYDIISYHRNHVYIHFGNGDGTFQPPKVIFDTSTLNLYIDSYDIDDDGDSDLLFNAGIGNGYGVVYLENNTIINEKPQIVNWSMNHTCSNDKDGKSNSQFSFCINNGLNDAVYKLKVEYNNSTIDTIIENNKFIHLPLFAESDNNISCKVLSIENEVLLDSTLLIQSCSNNSLSTTESNIHKGIIIFPNPTKNNIFIRNEGQYSFIGYSIYDVNGEKLASKDLNFDECYIDLSVYAKGIYFLNLYTDKNELIVKRIIRH